MKNYFAELELPLGFPAIQTLEYHEIISSTNDRVHQLTNSPGFPDFSNLPCLIVAGHQTAGRGRNGKSWWSGDGALLMSLGLELSSFSLSRSLLPLLSLTSGLSVAAILRTHLEEQGRVEIHWPNDVHVDGRKISGILIESPTPQTVIVGIGINVNNSLAEAPAEIRQSLDAYPITALIDLIGRKTEPMKLISAFLSRFFHDLSQLSVEPARIVREAERLCVQVNRDLKIVQGGTTIRGRCIGIGLDGALRITTPEGVQSVHCGVPIPCNAPNESIFYN